MPVHSYQEYETIFGGSTTSKLYFLVVETIKFLYYELFGRKSFTDEELLHSHRMQPWFPLHSGWTESYSIMSTRMALTRVPHRMLPGYSRVAQGRPAGSYTVPTERSPASYPRRSCRRQYSSSE